MTYLIGTDEAGYGPNLGPLVISASVWQVPDGVAGDGLQDLLARVIGRGKAGNGDRVAMADSKTLYQSGKGFRHLERGLWAAWSLLGQSPRTCAEVWDLLACGTQTARHAAFCGGEDDCPLPRDADQTEIAAFRPLLLEAFAAANVRITALRSRVVFPDEFNRTVEACGSKGAALSRWTLALAAEMIAPLPDSRISILCDKHGGRDRYLPLLLDSFPDVFVEIVAEGARQSVYRFGPPERRVEIGFQAKGESHLPTALASMASKYLRELAMAAFNRFWSDQVPGIPFTAGYPVDARRFREQIEPARLRLGIADTILWRTK